MKVNLTVDTKGDFYGERQSSLSTQTRYAFPVTGAISFPVLRNFSLGPTYSAFLYSNQVSQQSIVVHTFSISARSVCGPRFGRVVPEDGALQRADFPGPDEDGEDQVGV